MSRRNDGAILDSVHRNEARDRVKKRYLLIVAALTTTSADAQTPTTTARSLAATCTSCHGAADTNAADVPALAGVPKDDIVRIMRQYKTGTRAATVMQQLARGYTDDEIELIAAWFSAQNAGPRP
jgi:sulfide dehydrogenase cytochrome subunit